MGVEAALIVCCELVVGLKVVVDLVCMEEVVVDLSEEK